MIPPDARDTQPDGFEFACRYDVLGPPNGCQGQCEGTGMIPHAEYLRPAKPGELRRARDENEPPIYRVLWFLMEAVKPSNFYPHEDDAYHFIPCPDCKPDHALVVLARQLMGAK